MGPQQGPRPGPWLGQGPQPGQFLPLSINPSASASPRRLKQHSVRAGARAVILAPTRELALQVGPLKLGG